MKNFKNSLHILLTAASLLGFLGGWATLAHSRKPIQPVQAQGGQTLDPLQPLAPIPAFNSAASATAGSSGGLLSLFTQSQAPVQRLRRRPVFTTSGS
jgi:hypothetical protein